MSLINQSHLNELEQKGVLYFPHAAFNADWLDDLSLLGTIMKRGMNGVQQIKPIEHSAKRSFSLSFDALNPHTEGPYLNHPPRYLVLHGIHPAGCGGGLTGFCDGYALFKQLPMHLQDFAAKDHAFPVMNREEIPLPMELKRRFWKVGTVTRLSCVLAKTCCVMGVIAWMNRSN